MEKVYTLYKSDRVEAGSQASPHIWSNVMDKKTKRKYDKMEPRQVQCLYIGMGGMLKPKRKGAVFLEIEKIKDGMNTKEAIFTSRRYKTYESEFIDMKNNLFIPIKEDKQMNNNETEPNIKMRIFRIPGDKDDESNTDQTNRYRNNNEEQAESLKYKRKKRGYPDDENKQVELRRSSRYKKARNEGGPNYGLYSLLHIEIKEALNGENKQSWREAMDSEISSIIKMNTRTLIPEEEFKEFRKKNQDKVKLFKTKFILDFKEYEKKFKARLVVTSWMWKESRKDEFYSPVVEESTFFMLLNISVFNKWRIWNWDAKNAFLHGEIPDEYLIFVRPSAGIDDGYLWRLNKALYGLPISSKLWYENVRDNIIQAGWIQSRNDRCCFYVKNDKRLLGVLIVHGDDFQVTGEESTIIKLQEFLFEVYNMKSIEFTRYCGINIHRPNPHGPIYVDMEDYIDKLYTRFGKPTLRNLPYRSHYMKNISLGEEKGKDMREITGSLIFIAKVRPEIKYAVSMFCSMNDKYNEDIINEAKRIIGYLKHTSKEKLKIDPKNMELTAILDADFAGCNTSRKSRNGMMFLLGDSYLLARSKKQSCNTDSSTYAKTKCLVDGCKWIIYFRRFLDELGFIQGRPTKILQDNIQTIRIILKEGNQEKARGFDINFHQVQDYVRRGKIELIKTASRQVLVDALNKPVGKYL